MVAYRLPPGTNDPTGWDTPALVAASSLETPAAIACQNRTRFPRWATPGRPGDRVNTGRRARSERRRRGLIANASNIVVLRRPLDSAQYISIRYTERLAAAGIEPSVGSVGDSYDNALAETINGLYKTEVIRRRGPWKSLEAVELATLEWVDWFNHRRLLGPIGNVPPAEAEQRFFAQVDQMRTAA
jgi:transposase InsO family protein